MSKMSQVEAVITITTAVFSELGIEFTGNVNESITTEAKAEIKARLVSGFKSGEIELKSPQDRLESYVTGLMNHHYNRNSKLNGGIKYEFKNPGSRPTHPELKALLQLKAQYSNDPERLGLIEAEIASFKANLAEKAIVLKKMA